MDWESKEQFTQLKTKGKEKGSVCFMYSHVFLYILFLIVIKVLVDVLKPSNSKKLQLPRHSESQSSQILTKFMNSLTMFISSPNDSSITPQNKITTIEEES